MTLLAALLFSELRPPQHTNNQTSALAQPPRKTEASIMISVTPEGQSNREPAVAEESNLMKVLKANYKIEEKMQADHLWLTAHSQDEAKGLYWCTGSSARWLQKGATSLTVKKGDKIESHQEVYK